MTNEEKAILVSQLHTAIWLNIITALGIIVALGGLYFIWRTWKDTRDNFLQDQRAWVVPYEVQARVSNDGIPIGANLYYRNTGKSPALRFRIFIGWTGLKANIPEYDQDPSKNEHTAYPTLIIAPNGIGNSAPIIPNEVVESVNKGNPGGYIFGTLWYDDIFGKPHWMQFCYTIGSNFKYYGGCDVPHTKSDDQ